MTAGSYCYIGPQGIVHGTFVRTKCRERKTVFFILQITIMSAARKKLGTNDLRGKVFVSSGNQNSFLKEIIR